MAQRSAIAVYVQDDLLREAILQALPAYYERLVVPSITHLADIARITEGVVCASDINNTFLHSIRIRFPLYYVIDVRDNPHETGSVLLSNLSADSIPADLAQVVVRARTSKRLCQMMIAIGAATHLPRVIRYALIQLINPAGVIVSIDQLAESIGLNRRTLWHHWDQVMSERKTSQLNWLLNSVLLLKAVSLKTPNKTWAAVARSLEVHEDTLTRHAQKLLGVPLREIPDPAEDFVWSYLKPMMMRVIGHHSIVL